MAKRISNRSSRVSNGTIGSEGIRKKKWRGSYLRSRTRGRKPTNSCMFPRRASKPARAPCRILFFLFFSWSTSSLRFPPTIPSLETQTFPRFKGTISSFLPRSFPSLSISHSFFFFYVRDGSVGRSIDKGKEDPFPSEEKVGSKGIFHGEGKPRESSSLPWMGLEILLESLWDGVGKGNGV